MTNNSATLAVFIGLLISSLGVELHYEDANLDLLVEKEPVLLGASDGIQKRMEIAKAHLDGSIMRPVPKVPKVVHNEDVSRSFFTDSETGAHLELSQLEHHPPGSHSASIGLGVVIVIVAWGGISALRMRIGRPLIWIKRQRLWKSLHKYEPHCKKPSTDKFQLNTPLTERARVHCSGPLDAMEGFVIHRTQGSENKLMGLIQSDIEQGVIDGE